MPPKPKFEKNEIIYAALEIIRKSGANAVTAREVANRLGCSSRPIFTFFDSMEELMDAVKTEAMEQFFDFLKIADDYTPSLKMRGLQLIRFAKQNPNVFELLFMDSRQDEDFDLWLSDNMKVFESDIASIVRTYSVTDRQAKRIFSQLWLTAHGICTLCITGVCTFSEEEILTVLGESFAGAILFHTTPNHGPVSRMPVLKNTACGQELQNENILTYFNKESEENSYAEN